MDNYNGVEIAIIGMSGQFPGADDVKQFWENLKKGEESISFFSEDEALNEGEDKNSIKNPSYIKANAYLKDKEYFDAAFFGYTPSEAKLMDPQLRLFHENCWKALEDAGCDVTTNNQKIGLFAGASSNVNWLTYSLLINMDNSVNSFNAFQLRDATFLCSRVSYLMNLQGPSVYINTACSTSLVAIQRACMSLLLRECKIALAGGVTVKNYSKKGYIHEEGMIDSKDGHCRTFDAQASGTVGGEGVGVVVLKRLTDAIADGDHIYAIIKGSGVNNDGANKIAYTAPSIDGQSQAIMKAMTMSKIPSESISYVEAHGTATKLGDPIEVEALINSFGKSTEKYCALGSVKTNVGHLDIAAGVAGFMKTVLSLKNRQIPANLHYKNPNPKINFAESPFYVNTELKNWKNDNYPLRAGVSSFGIGGTNAHVILEEAPVQIKSSDSRDFQLLTFSAKTQSALKRNINNFRNYLTGNDNTKLADIAYTLQVGRASLGHRKSIVSKSKEETIRLLESYKVIENKKHISDIVKPTTVFMFSGQGSQHLNMCYDLYQSEPFFKEKVDSCFQIVKEKFGKDLKEVLFADSNSDWADKINDTEFTQPLLFIVEYSLAQLMIKWGIIPNSMVGHSIGEYVAACISGVFTLEDSLKLVVKRGELMQKVAKGVMLSISITEEKLFPLLSKYKEISLAAVNSSELCVVSGKYESIEEFKLFIDKQGFNNKIIKTSHAFHSYMMDEILDEFETIVKSVKINKQQIPFYSNISGKLAVDEEISQPLYWVKHLRGTVRFSNNIEELVKNKKALIIEIGPGKVLSSLVKSHNYRKQEHAVVNLMRHPYEEVNDQQHLLSALGLIWEQGVEPEWNNFYEKEEVRLKVSLPTYSFDKVEFPTNVDAFKMIMEQSLGGTKTPSSWYYTPSWKKESLRLDNSANEKKKEILLFVDDYGIGDLVLEKFNENSEKVICVRKGKEFCRDNSGAYFINPSNEKDYQKLFQSLSESKNSPDKVIIAWSVTKDDHCNQSSYNGHFSSLLNIAKGLNEFGDLNDKQIIVLTNDLHCISGDEVIKPEKATQLGLLKVISQEYSWVSTSHIDISLQKKLKKTEIQKLYEEIKHIEGGKTVSLRNTNRWVQIFDNIKIEPIELLNNFRQNGTYLITGGLGNLGFTIAKYLLDKYKAKVILLGRSSLPAEEEWNNILTDNEISENVKTKIQRLQELEKTDGKVRYKACDISNESEFSNIIDDVEGTWGIINGVIHAAGVVNGDTINLINQLSKNDFEQQFSAKIDGLNVLETVLKNKQLDFCYIVSSLSSILGGLGFGAYASANTYIDYLVSSKREREGINNWLCVNFDGFDFSNDSIEENSLNIEEIQQTLELTLSIKNLSQVIVSKKDLQIRLDDWINRKQSSINLDEKPFDQTDLAYEHLNSDFSLNAVETALVALWQDFFGKSIDIEDNFFDIGGDSLKALTILRRIHKTFNVELTIKEFFDNSTVKLLGNFIIDKKGKVTHDYENTGYSSIPKAEVKEFYQLSSVQKRLYFLYEFAKSSLAYNLPRIVKLEGSLNKEHLKEVFTKLILRHESLRTSFKLINGEPVQRIDDQVTFEIATFYSKESEVASVIDNFIKPFDLSESPLLRVGLIETGLDSHILMVDMHHIISDGVSQGVLISDFMKLYNNEELSPLNSQYKDYAEWQQREDHKQKVLTQKDFWHNEFAEEITLLDIPTNFSRPLESSHKGESVTIELNESEVRGIQSLAEKEKATNFMVLLSIFNIFLSKLSNQEDVVVGSPVAGRQHSDFDNVIGMFVNTLPIRNFPKGELTFKEFLANVKSNAITCFDNQDYPYEELVEDLKVERNTSRNPLFDAMFEYQTSFEDTVLKIPGLNLTIYNNVEENTLTVSKFDLLLSAVESNDGLSLKLEYSYDLFTRETIERFIKYYKKVVNTVINNSDIKLSDITLIDNKEELAVVYELNNTKISYDKEDTIIKQFERQSIITPTATAIQFEKEVLSYEELKEESDKLASYLKEVKEINSGDLVGIMLDRELHLVPSIFGVLKAGAAFVPIDPKLPIERVNTIIKDANLKTLITRSQYKSASLDINIFNLDDEMDHVRNYKSQLYLSNEIKNNDLAYVLFTSGSTGNPKGVMIEHKSLANYINWGLTQYVKESKSTFPLFTSISFDLTITSIFTPLVSGNKLVMYPDNEKESLVEEVFLNSEIDVIKLTPSHLKIIKDIHLQDSNLFRKRIIVGGEDFEMKLANEIYQKFNGNIDIYNEYGPTEATVGCMIYKFRTDEDLQSVPIGFPISNTQIYILDRFLKPVPAGVNGELYISGEGLSRGYLSNEDLTTERFIDNPFIKGEKMYKTGDLAKQLPNGNIVFKGRVDDQVKIRGFRIELGEIESKLYTFSEIKEAIVVAKDKNGEKYLVAYLVANQPVNVEQLRDYLLTQLPDYMVPMNYIQLDQLPLTRNGKLDKRALPEVCLEDGFKAPKTKMEHNLAEIYANVLKLEKEEVSVNKSFFELGGNSIRVILLISSIRKISNVKLSLKDVFDNPSIEKLSKVIENASKEKELTIARVEKMEHYPASSAQERMYYQQSLEVNNMGWNIFTSLEINKEINIDKLTQAFQKLIDRHECLRTSFNLLENGVVQKINEKVRFKLDIINENDYDDVSEAFNHFVRPFNLSDESLFRGALFVRKSKCNVLFIDVHHIVCDGISLDILIKDFKALYEGQDLKPLKLRYVDFTVWQMSLNEKMQNQKNYWEKRLSGQLPRLELPTLQDRNNISTYTVSTSVLEINGELYENIKKFTTEAKVSNFMFLLSVYYLLLSKTSENNDVIIGTDAIGRTHPELNGLVGTFVNILPLRVQVSPNISYLDFLSEVKDCVLTAFDNQDFQFDQMVSLISKEDRTARNPIVDVHFAVSDTVEGEEELKALSLTPILINKDVRTSTYEFKIEVNESNNQMNIVFIYSNELYNEEIIDVLKSYYHNILNSILNNTSTNIESIELEFQEANINF